MHLPPLLLLLAAPPGAPGVGEALAEARQRLDRGGAVRLLLAHEGLAWAQEPVLLAWPGPKALCARDGADRHWTLASTPPGLAWSSVTAALGALAEEEEAWLLLP